MAPVRTTSICFKVLAGIAATIVFLPSGAGPGAAPQLAHPAGTNPTVVELLAIGPGRNGQSRECGATGFLVNEDGYILTNAHVVEQARQCLAGSPGAKILARPASGSATVGRAVSCDVVTLDDLHDLALLKTVRPLFADSTQIQEAVARLVAGEVADGARVGVTGHPAFAWRPLTQFGQVIQHASLALSDHNSEPSQVLILNIELHRGNSGSPVYLVPSGGVIGIAERRDILHASRTIAVPMRYAIELLDRTGVKWHSAKE
jgi:S1-C subfamily serine protease